MDILKSKMGDRIRKYVFPPPVFVTMGGKFIGFDLDQGFLSAKFPVLESYLNPYGAMQGGMVGAAVDNTLGPLSVLIAPPNVTRKLEVIYSHPITMDMEYIVIKARLLERMDPRLYFAADVYNYAGLRLARSKAVHIILD
jgi:acyl-coenzyme A thioesterase PaaI-like protein